MNNYLVDYENVSKNGLYGVVNLSEEDTVYIFYSKNVNKLSFELFSSLNASAADIRTVKVNAGTKNALDFQLSLFLGCLISENAGLPCNYYIVSKDKGFDVLIDFCKSRAKVYRRDNVDTFTEEIRKLIENEADACKVAKIINKYKTKSGINNALQKEFPDENNQKAKKIYRAIKPLISNKKGTA